MIVSKPTTTVFLFLAFLPSCSDFLSPAELDRPQLVGIRATPTTVPPGGTAQLEALFLGPEGEMSPDSITWQAIAPGPGQATVGQVNSSGATASFLAPASVNEPTIASVEATAMFGQKMIVGIKGVGVGAVSYTHLTLPTKA